jgi:subtilase family serine protease
MMNSRLAIALAALGILSACGGDLSSNPTGQFVQPDLSRFRDNVGHRMTAAQLGLWPRPGPAVPLCGPVPAGYARCFAWRRTDIAGIGPAGIAYGYGPSDLQAAYNLAKYSRTGGKGKTVAVVDAYNDPYAESDLAVYRKYFHLPKCSSSNGCFTKQAYTTTIDEDWAGEQSLDVDMVSAICPNCHIVLVEAASSSIADLSAAEQYATAHAGFVSNSWGYHESARDYDKYFKPYDKYFSVKGVTITASSGDHGYIPPAWWPAILTSVTGAGGTSLYVYCCPELYWYQTSWAYASSSCSTIYKTPSFQKRISTGCSERASADASAVADPNTGVAIFDSYIGHGWAVSGGTSAASPIIASVFALAGNAGSNNNAYLYEHASGLTNVTSGPRNGPCGPPLCQPGTGWNGPTGLGTPNGIAAF